MANHERRQRLQRHSRPPPQHLFCSQPQQLGPHYGSPASGIWCERCGRAGREARIRAAREPRRFNGTCGTCSERGNLSCHCLLRRDLIYSDIPTLSSPPQINRSGRGVTGYDLPMSPPLFSGRSGATAVISRGLRRSAAVVIVIVRNRLCDTLAAATVQLCRRSGNQPPVPFQLLSGSRGTTAATVQRCGRSSSQAPASFSSFGWEQRYNGDGTAPSPQQQPDPRPFCSFG